MASVGGPCASCSEKSTRRCVTGPSGFLERHTHTRPACPARSSALSKTAGHSRPNRFTYRLSMNLGAVPSRAPDDRLRACRASSDSFRALVPSAPVCERGESDGVPRPTRDSAAGACGPSQLCSAQPVTVGIDPRPVPPAWCGSLGAWLASPRLDCLAGRIVEGAPQCHARGTGAITPTQSGRKSAR